MRSHQRLRSGTRLAVGLLGLAMVVNFAATEAKAVQVTYEYDAVGRLTKVIQDGEQLTYGFGANGHLETVAVPEPGARLMHAAVLLTLAALRRRLRYRSGA